jgi:hypothetical protein
MFGGRTIAVAVLVAVSVVGTSRFSAAEMLNGEERETFIAGTTKACVDEHGQGYSANLTKPVFEQYCACMANGLADRLSKAELIKQAEQADVSKENEAVVNEEAERCLAKQGGRELFIATATKSCIGTYKGKKGTLAKPAFERYCGCVANGVAGRVPVADLMKDADLSKANDAIVDEEAARCYAEQGGRDIYVANAVKSCVGTYSKKNATMTKPLFERYCTCVANGTADRIPMTDLIKDPDKGEMTQENQTIVDEEIHRCLAAANAPGQTRYFNRQ